MERLPDSLWPTVEEQSGWWTLGVVEPMFVVSYVIGLVVLMIFSWHRLFNEHVFDTAEAPEKILRLMPPGNLRGTVAVTQAYLIYAALMMLVYTVLSWGGSFVWSVMVQLNFGLVAGQPTAADAGFKFNDPSWPLAVSLGLVGILTHLPYLKEVELTFRRWAHRSIGIPPFIKQLTQLVLNTRFDGAQISDRAAAELRDQDAAVEAARAVVGDNDVDDFGKRLRRIALLERWVLNDQAPWPRVDVMNAFEPIVRELRRDINDLHDDVAGAVILLSDITAVPKDSREPAKQDQAVRKWRDLFAKAETVHRDLCALVAVFVENDPKLPEDDLDPMLRRFLDEIKNRRDEEAVNWDRILTIVLGVGALVFAMTWVATLMGYNPGFADFSPVATAALQTAIVVAIYGPASLIALTIQNRQEGLGKWRKWERANGSYPVRQYLWVFFWTYLVSALMLVAFYFVLFLALANELATGVDNFQRFIPFYLAYAVLGGLQGIFSPLAHSYNAQATLWTRVRLPLIHAALAALVLVVGYSALGHLVAGEGRNAVLIYWFLIFQASVVAFAATYLSAWTAPPPLAKPAGGPSPVGGAVRA